MAKKKSKHRPGMEALPSPVIEERVRKALRDGRSQQALELARQLHRQEPTPAHLELLRTASLERARQLRAQGRPRDAVTVLENAVPLAAGDSGWLARLAEELAACGQVRQSLNLLNGLSDPSARARALGQAADSALAQGTEGRKLLPEDLQGPFDLVLRAFALAEAGQDEPAREALQGIGLQSPFLEWKLLLRGLLAYYQGDDTRAIENWSRLNPDRLPARLAAPLRFAIDPAYRAAQPPEMQMALRQQGDRLQGSTLVQQMRGVQTALVGDRHLAPAFRLAEKVAPALRQEAPQLVPRLASCFYWAIVTGGQPEDMTRYRRVFGEPPDDPGFHRLQALVNEQIGQLDQAHQHWQRFEEGVARNPSVWPAGQADRVRALVWNRMGHNADSVPNVDRIPGLPAYLRNHPDRPRPLNPSAEKCYLRSIELAPDQRNPYEALLEHYLKEDNDKKAGKAARRLLERFPEDVPTLEALGDLCMRQQDYAEALSLFQRALKHNPLHRGLRSRVCTAHLFHARTQAEAGRFDEARAEYQAALVLEEPGGESTVYCKWAACEFKAGDTARAEELLQKALGNPGGRLAVAFNMLIETIRLKLPRTLKTRFDREFTAALAEPPTAAGAVAIAETASAHRAAGVSYVGQKTHEKKVKAYLEKARSADFTEVQLTELCEAVLVLAWHPLLRSFTALGRERFPKNPSFNFLEAESYIALGPSRCPTWKVLPLLEKAASLARELPPDEKRDELLETIEQRRQMVAALNPFSMDFLQNAFDLFGDDFDDDDEGPW